MGDLLHEKNFKNDRGQPSLLATQGALLLVLISLTTFLLVTPSGLLRKADMVGYAVCHQIESHSFVLSGRALPLCARCTGTFLGALMGLLGQVVILRRRRASRFPPAGILAVLIGFTLLWAADGLNSYLTLVGGPHLYEPTNTLRLVTGAFNGLTMSAIVYPVFNISLWRRPDDCPGIRGWRDLSIMLLMEAALVGTVLSRQDFLLYPLAILGAVAVLALLTGVNTVLAIILLRRETSTETWRQALMPISVGLLLSFVQIGLIDLARFALTGTLDGIPLQ